MSRIVVTGRVPDAAIEKLRLEHEVDAWPGPESISPEELLRRVAGADAILSLLTERVDGELLDAAGPQLKVVANVAVGYDNIDVAACRERGVVATNTPGTSLPHMYAQAGVRLVYVEAFPSSRLYRGFISARRRTRYRTLRTTTKARHRRVHSAPRNRTHRSGRHGRRLPDVVAVTPVIRVPADDSDLGSCDGRPSARQVAGGVRHDAHAELNPRPGRCCVVVHGAQ